MELPRIAELAGSRQAGRQEPRLLTPLLKRCPHVSVGAPPRAGTGCEPTPSPGSPCRDPAVPTPGRSWSCPGSDGLPGAHVMLG